MLRIIARNKTSFLSSFKWPLLIFMVNCMTNCSKLNYYQQTALFLILLNQTITKLGEKCRENYLYESETCSKKTKCNFVIQIWYVVVKFYLKCYFIVARWSSLAYQLKYKSLHRVAMLKSRSNICAKYYLSKIYVSGKKRVQPLNWELSLYIEQIIFLFVQISQKSNIKFIIFLF
jgi:hypothetical protein